MWSRDNIPCPSDDTTPGPPHTCPTRSGPGPTRSGTIYTACHPESGVGPVHPTHTHVHVHVALSEPYKSTVE